MPDETPCLALPFLLPAQAQTHVTHNHAHHLAAWFHITAGKTALAALSPLL